MIRVAAFALLLTVGCGPSTLATPSASRVAIAPPSSASDAGANATSSEFYISESGELALPARVTFVVRPLAGPGSMGPSELSPESEPALKRVADFSKAHPEARVRVECAVNAIKTSSGPNAARGAHLARLVTRALSERGVACDKLEAVGVLVERDPDAPAEHVRVFVRERPVQKNEARAEACR